MLQSALFRGERGYGTFASVQSQVAREYIACACGGTFSESGQKYRRKYLYVRKYVYNLFDYCNDIFLKQKICVYLKIITAFWDN